MAFCGGCGGPGADEDRFCRHCGAPMRDGALVGAEPRIEATADASITEDASPPPEPPPRWGQSPATTIPGMQAPGPAPLPGGAAPIIPDVAPQFAGAPNVPPPHGRVVVVPNKRQWPKRLLAIVLLAALGGYGVHWYRARAEAASRKDPAEAKAELKQAIKAQRTYFSKHLKYESDPEALREINPELDWGDDVKVAVNNADEEGEASVVCIWERTSTGKTYSIATSAALGKKNKFGNEPCPESPTEEHVRALDSEW